MSRLSSVWAAWLRAPLSLRHHKAVFAAVLLSYALAALAAASAPLVRAGVESESLRGTVRTMSPYTAGLEVQSSGPVAQEASRRLAALTLARRFGFTGKPVRTVMAPGVVRGVAGSDVPVMAIARTDVLDHVERLRSNGRPGVWISATTAKALGLRVGSTMLFKVFEHQFWPGRVTSVELPVNGIYGDLEGRYADPYWANFVRDIAPKNPDLPPPPAFVVMPERTLVRVAGAVGPIVNDRFEYPLDPSRLTRRGALRLERQFQAVRRELVSRRSDLARQLGCTDTHSSVAPNCSASSALDSALGVARQNAADVQPTVSFLSTLGLLLALALAASVGVFITSRRRDEVQFLFARGEAPLSFGARVVVETALPAALGCAIGFGAALLSLRAFAPAGTLDGTSVAGSVWRVAAACAVALVAGGTAAALAFPRLTKAKRDTARRVSRRVPWELASGAAAAVAAVLVVRGGAITHDATGGSHPNVAVLLLPTMAIATLAGVVVRAGRRALRFVGFGWSVTAFLAARRLADARGLLVAVMVAAAAAFGVFGYALTVSASLQRSVAEKGYVDNGSDVQGVIDPSSRLTKPLPFPVATAWVDWTDVTLESGEATYLIAGEPRELQRTIRWGTGWSDDPRPKLHRLAGPATGPLRAIATPETPSTPAIIVRGERLPIRIVARARFPGTAAGQPALLVSRRALTEAARRAGVGDPLPAAEGLVWARGNPATVEAALGTSSLDAVYLTRLGSLSRRAPVGAAERTFRYLRVIGIVCGALSLLALLLYIQARQRSQLIASALTRRMGLSPAGDAGALALEAAVIVAAASVVGMAGAVVAARLLVPHLDPLPLYAPRAFLIVPWTELTLTALVAVACAAIAGATTAVVAARSNVVEALRVA